MYHSNGGDKNGSIELLLPSHYRFFCVFDSLPCLYGVLNLRELPSRNNVIAFDCTDREQGFFFCSLTTANLAQLVRMYEHEVMNKV